MSLIVGLLAGEVAVGENGEGVSLFLFDRIAAVA
jgi:hypothetical protein